MPFATYRGPMHEPVANARAVAVLSLPMQAMRRIGKHYGASLHNLPTLAGHVAQAWRELERLTPAA